MTDSEITFVTSKTDDGLTSQQTRYSCKSSTLTVAAARSISNNNHQGWEPSGKMSNWRGPRWLKGIWGDAHHHQQSKKCILKQQWDVTLCPSDWPKLENQIIPSFWCAVDVSWDSHEE